MQKDALTSESKQPQAANASIEEVLQGIEDQDSTFRNCIILTPNHALAQQLYGMRLKGLNRNNNRAGNIKVLNSFLTESIGNLATCPLGTSTQLLFLWQMALEKTQSDFPELDFKTLAPQALSAWQNLKSYRVTQDELRTAEIGQLVRFSDSIKAFEALLKQKKLSTIELEITRVLSSKPAIENPQSRCYLYGFIEPPPPLFQSWLECNFETLEGIPFLSKKNSQSFLHCAQDEASELSAAGIWAAEILKADKNAQVGIVHTQLGQELNRASRLVRDELPPDTEFSTSLKPPISQVGPIACALDLIRLNQNQLDFAAARRIIQNPFWSDFAEEYESRAKWETDLCHLQTRHIKPSQFVELLDDDDLQEGKNLAKRLLRFIETKRRRSEACLPIEWADLFHQQLAIFGWPGATNPRHNIPFLTDWYDLLQEFAQLGAVSGAITLNQALRELQRCCDKPKTDPGSSHTGVRLLNTIEGAINYTHLWIIGMNSDSWPAPTNPNPLIPISLQRNKGLPRSSPEHEIGLAQHLINRARSAANQIIFSYAAVSNGLEQKPTLLLPKLEELPSSEALNEDNPSSPLIAFESVDTEFAPPLVESEKQILGGASLLRAMAASPFDAFAQWRLGASTLPEPKTGLDAAERGTLVHWVLDAIWKRLGSSDALKSMAQSDLDALCEEISKKEVQRWQHRYGWLTKAYQDLEIERLSRLAKRWLELEAQRNVFQIRESETRLEATLGALHFTLRLDRLDELPDGSLILIDYKTGQSISKNNWLDLPPTEPQLPLYALCLETTPNAICFAQVRPDQMRLTGIGRQVYEQGIAEIEDWGEQIEKWRSSLTELATQYENGLARVDATLSGFNRKDPLAPLHRMNERIPLMEWLERHSD